MSAVKTDRKVYLLYQAPYQSNADDLEAFNVHIKVSKLQNGVLGYHLGLVEISLQEKHNITRDTAIEDHKIGANINDI